MAYSVLDATLAKKLSRDIPTLFDHVISREIRLDYKRDKRAKS